ncbi:MAG: fatty acid desaturase [bacterium]|nr:fatty acid desaturase [bacterium]
MNHPRPNPARPPAARDPYGELKQRMKDTGPLDKAPGFIVGLVHTTLLIGMGYGWWLDKHNAHHANPNGIDLDPDIDLPVLAFSEEDALSKRGFERFMVKHQRTTFFPLLPLQAIHLRVETVKFLLRSRRRR